jgi:hypothetical protein
MTNKYKYKGEMIVNSGEFYYKDILKECGITAEILKVTQRLRVSLGDEIVMAMLLNMVNDIELGVDISEK